MATAVQRRRGTTAEHAAFTGLAGELTVDTSKGAVVVHDGMTAGGSPQATEAALSQHAEDAQAHGISVFGASLVDDADAATARGTLGLGDSAGRAVGTGPGTVAAGDHDHAGVYEPADATLLKTADIGTGPGTVAAGDHDHAGIYEPADEMILKVADIGTGPGTIAAGNHDHAGVYEPADATLLKTADIGTGPGTVAAGDHLHAGVYEPADETILKAADIGTASGTIAAGDHNHGGDAANLGSGNASAGQVLMANGSGGASWSTQARITVSATAPENPLMNDIWIDIS